VSECCCDLPIAPPRRGWLESRVAGSLKSLLGQVQGGQIHFDDGWSAHTYGTPGDDQLAAQLSIQDSGFYRQLMTGGSLGFAESFLQGHWTTDDLTSLLRILCRNMDHTSAVDSGLQRVLSPLHRLGNWWASNTPTGSRRNIAAHYDLSNPFFELFLDSSLAYSAAYFESETCSLEQASIAKYEQVCRKLQLKAADRLLEIGTGWGGLALHAAKNYGCRVDTTTISKNQFDEAARRISQAGYQHQIKIEATDYRQLQGQYDKLVSIEMIEAVGYEFLDTYFRKCSDLLRPGGRFVMQAIVMPEQRFESYRRSRDFIQKYIFPGGFLPSLASIAQSVGRTSSLRMHSLEDISPHYATTLAHWRERFCSRLDDVRRLGFDDRFIRMWEYYLCYCEAAFRERAVNVVQIVWDKPPR
jgi:cyclopropane-fatty-acyl-phospholipid synthase